MLARETKDLEYKESVSSTFLKTVSAYANYGTGCIIFGVSDTGEVVGLADPVTDSLRIENMINDSVEPAVRFTLESDLAAKTVTLTVFEGMNKPYLVKGKAYKRNDSSTVAVDRLEYGRLVLQGSNMSFDETPSSAKSLTFNLLEEKLHDALGITSLTDDVMRTLDLISADGTYTKAANLLADINDFKGIDIVRFGDSINDFLDRAQFEGVSIIAQFEGALNMFEKYYCFERVNGSKRELIEMIPRDAFREAVANAIVHRAWDVPANMSISMHPDKIVIVSPGSLPAGLSLESYRKGGISLLRNPIIANVFFRLNYIENFGTGVMRIRGAYERCSRQPNFDANDDSVTIVLPVMNERESMTPDEEAVYDAIGQVNIVSRSAIEQTTGFSKDKVIRLLNALEAKGLIEKHGNGRGIRYARVCLS